MKAPVEFRKMLSSSSLLLSADKGESISSTTLKEAAKPAEDTRMPTSRKTEVAFPQRGGVASSHEEENLTTPATGGGLRKELAEEQTSSSSSSESDSSSDSEDENADDSQVAIKTKVEFPRRGAIFSENIAVKASMLAKEKLSQKSLKDYGIKKLPRKPEINVSPVKQVKLSKTSVSQETSKSKARDPKVKSPPKEQKLVLEPHVVKSLDLTDVARKFDHVEEKSFGTQVAAIQLKASAMTQEDKKQDLLSRGEKEKMKEAQELEAKEVTAPKVEETSGSKTLVMGTTAKEETTQEAGVQAGESSTIEETAQPAPEEFDNSTYKNLQHHEYHTFTFHDYIAVLAKYRQPQPSSGRPSPRH
ncbi:NADH dehydrogenase [ubiquinone] flavoprotein 3, mitochondrial isoform X2 [Vidua chalybeata]|nr:NADH dehydrogenase [ubiquinone] flavoprotein 3, mitochondrial isoform X2 [Vidua chalybeata]XP_053791185.1 NADH dehydrogenase [ubiquinone] flavoprotein 3, mitochondrial isoform X2 [Vidua chalybeata]XP_053791186.1 NADH dehydrogenase [ubiquinone] flavoprotein 3, mitochondrial isoform X2 [Vidua chalybeata]